MRATEADVAAADEHDAVPQALGGHEVGQSNSSTGDSEGTGPCAGRDDVVMRGESAAVHGERGVVDETAVPWMIWAPAPVMTSWLPGGGVRERALEGDEFPPVGDDVPGMVRGRPGRWHARRAPHRRRAPSWAAAAKRARAADDVALDRGHALAGGRELLGGGSDRPHPCRSRSRRSRRCSPSISPPFGDERSSRRGRRSGHRLADDRLPLLRVGARMSLR